MPLPSKEDTNMNKGTAKKRKFRRRLLAAFWLLLLLLALAATVVMGLYIGGAVSSRKNMAANIENTLTEQETVTAIPDSDLVQRNGKKYRYNDKVITVLAMGIDSRENGVSPMEKWGDAGLADTVFLVALNTATGQMQLISISRDTMTELNCYDETGNFVGYAIDHLSVGYFYGDNAHGSCKAMVEDVSKLFYGLPINLYCSFSMDAIPLLNDAVGGVTVTIPEEYLTTMGYSPYSAGQSVTLQGNEARSFVQNRNCEADGSNNDRMARQKQYAVGFIQSAKQAIKENPSLPMELYRLLSDSMCTNLNASRAVYLAQQALALQFSEENIRVVQGTNNYDGEYDEFYVDKEALIDMILEVFYEEVEK